MSEDGCDALTDSPMKSHRMPTILPAGVVGTLSPYPTVVIVTKAHLPKATEAGKRGEERVSDGEVEERW